MPTILITGANRGLGLEFTRQYAAAGWRVLATVRDPLSGRAASEAGGEVYVADVADITSLRRLKETLKGVSLDIVLNNAGIYGQNQDFGAVDADGFLRVMRVNALAPLQMAEIFVDQVVAGGIIAAMSSKMGSVAENTSGGIYAYRASKAALNMVVKSLALDLRDRTIAVVALSPGWVRTDMGGTSAPLESSQAVAGMRAVLDKVQLTDSGKFFHFDGSEVAW
ncbi:SDR family oxidoreductase [Magnetospirillum sulfuroxidans]|uniref:SDR family oxidoreductase n=1 Tax=Magnetospirillum sulfuroxidans TaxID=611300 RepID=A0ABS5IDK0_9PROT|nr:SDR family oxidoreductase [Magnetospirillum sulfuroxidans]MBR9972491.1 SDR family oxidoreductase [Magnetospirillum sulfuroxidans]